MWSLGILYVVVCSSMLLLLTCFQYDTWPTEAPAGILLWITGYDASSFQKVGNCYGLAVKDENLPWRERIWPCEISPLYCILTSAPTSACPLSIRTNFFTEIASSCWPSCVSHSTTTKSFRFIFPYMRVKNNRCFKLSKNAKHWVEELIPNQKYAFKWKSQWIDRPK